MSNGVGLEAMEGGGDLQTEAPDTASRFILLIYFEFIVLFDERNRMLRLLEEAHSSSAYSNAQSKEAQAMVSSAAAECWLRTCYTCTCVNISNLSVL